MGERSWAVGLNSFEWFPRPDAKTAEDIPLFIEAAETVVRKEITTLNAMRNCGLTVI